MYHSTLGLRVIKKKKTKKKHLGRQRKKRLGVWGLEVWGYGFWTKVIGAL